MSYIIIRTITIFFSVLDIAIFIRCFLSWLPIPRDNPISNIIIGVTEPILSPIRRLFNNSPIGGGTIDFSPIIAFILLNIVERLLLKFILTFLIVF